MSVVSLMAVSVVMGIILLIYFRKSSKVRRDQNVDGQMSTLETLTYFLYPLHSSIKVLEVKLGCIT